MTRIGTACLLMLGLLSGCALWPISEAECKPPSWQQRGYDDGFGGHPPQDLRLAKECRRFGVEISEKDYLAGYHVGRLEWEGLRRWKGSGIRPSLLRRSKRPRPVRKNNRQGMSNVYFFSFSL